MAYRMYDLIEKKKHKSSLSREELSYIVSGFTAGEIPDYQMSAFLMAVWFNGLDKRETYDLTMLMRDSGDVMDLSAISGIKVDKHSTGGVGDKVTLVLAPMIAALGIPMTKMSGRGLGHTGGTIDKLEAFPGFMTSISEDQFVNNVNRYKIAVAGQTKNLAPADKKIYALRDATACVDQLSLIASSIMSKKLASGADGICLDVKVGSGAFMKNKEDAKKLAETMVDIGKRANKKMVALLTNMDEPLGNAVGNTLEVMEAVDALKGNGPADLMEVVYALGVQMLVMAEKADDPNEARALLKQTIEDNSAFETFVSFIEAQGGNREDVLEVEKLLKADIVLPVKAPCDGCVSRILADRIGHASMLLGGGREKKEDAIDLSVGIKLNKKVADPVKKDEVIAYVYANDEGKAKTAGEEVLSSYTFLDGPTEKIPMILDVIR